MQKTEGPYFNNTDISTHLKRVHDSGAAHAPGLARNETLEHLAALLKSTEPFHIEKAGRNFYYFNQASNLNQLDIIGSELTGIVRRDGTQFEGLSKWYPTNFAALQYQADSFFPPHKDNPDNLVLIATLSIEGEAEYTHLKPDKKTIIEVFHLKPGDVVFSRAEGLNPSVPWDLEDTHSVGGALGQEPRLSLGFRYWPITSGSKQEYFRKLRRGLVS